METLGYTSFEIESGELSFTTNINPADLTGTFLDQPERIQTFGGAVFAGDGFNQYVVLLPDMNDTISATNFDFIGSRPGGVLTPPPGVDGTRYVQVENIPGGKGLPDPVYITFDQVVTDGYEDLELVVALTQGAGRTSFSDEDHLTFAAFLDDDISTTTIGRVAGNDGGSVLQVDTNLDGSGDGDAVTQNEFSDYTFAIPAETTSVDLQIVVRLGGTNREVAIDNVRIRGREAEDVSSAADWHLFN